MSIYNDYESRGLSDCKLRTAEDVKILHGTDILAMKGLNKLSENDRNLVIQLFISYLNGCGCNSRTDVPVNVTAYSNKFKVTFDDGSYSYLFRNGTIG